MTSTIQRTAVRLDSLTGVRAIAAALVFWHHSAGVYGGASSGMVGVSLFYMLSGFVMAWTDRTRDTPTAATFYRRRFARIYPAYAVAVLIAIAYAAITIGVTWKDFFAFTLLQSWVPDKSVFFAASAVFWSLSCEAFFYLVFPALRALVRRLTTRGMWVLASIAAVASISIAGATAGLPESAGLTWAVVVFPAARLPEFVVGVCLGVIMARGWRPAIPQILAWALAIAAVIAAMFVPYSLSRYAVTLIPFAILIVTLAATDLRSSHAFTRSRLMVTLGVWSYCFYLTHLVVLMVMVSIGKRFGTPLWLVLIAALVGSVVAAWLLHVLVERPAERALRPQGRARLDTD